MKTPILIDNATGGGIPVEVRTEQIGDVIRITMTHSNISMTLVVDAEMVRDPRTVDDGR